MTLRKRLRGFVARQLDDRPTIPQRLFDLAVGVLLPIACVVYDPIVLHGALRTHLLGLMGLLMATLALWLAVGRRLGSAAGAVAGVLRVGVALSALVGLPLVLIAAWFTFGLIGWMVEAGLGTMPPIDGTMYLLVLLGWTPLGTLLVYVRNAHRASAVAHGQPRARPVAWLASGLTVLSFVTSVTIAHRVTHRALTDLRSDDPALAERATERLVRWEAFARSSSVLLNAWRGTRDAAEREAYNEAFCAIRGYSINESTLR